MSPFIRRKAYGRTFSVCSMVCIHFACRNHRRQPPWERGRLARILRWRSPITGYAGGMSAFHAFAAVAAIWAGEAPALPGGGYADGVVQVERLRRKLWLERLQICFSQVARWCSIEKLRNLCLIMQMFLWLLGATSNCIKAGLRVGVTAKPRLGLNSCMQEVCWFSSSP